MPELSMTKEFEKAKFARQIDCIIENILGLYDARSSMSREAIKSNLLNLKDMLVEAKENELLKIDL